MASRKQSTKSVRALDVILNSDFRDLNETESVYRNRNVVYLLLLGSQKT